MGDRLRVGIPSRYVPSQLGHPSGVAQSSTSFGWRKGGNVTFAGWQATLCNPMWHVSSRSGVATLRTCYSTRHLDRFSRFAAHAVVTNSETACDTSTDHAAPSVAIGRIYTTHAMRPKIRSVTQWRIYAGRWGRSPSPSKRAGKIFLNVSENKSSDRKLS